MRSSKTTMFVENKFNNYHDDFPHLIRSDPWLVGELHAVESPSARPRNDPGFSDVMRGSVWGNGNSEKDSIWDSAREVFKLR